MQGAAHEMSMCFMFLHCDGVLDRSCTSLVSRSGVTLGLAYEQRWRLSWYARTFLDHDCP